MSNVITLLTDFGIRDSYVAQLKGVLLRQATQALQIVDISHEVPPQDIRTGARLLREAAMWFPSGSVHLAVVDPGVGTSRRIVAVEIAQQRFVLPDNGLLSRVLDDFPVTSARVVESLAPSGADDRWPGSVSATFHGRDLMAPASLYLAEGGSLASLGGEAGGLERVPAAVVREVSGGWLLEVVGTDQFGNVLTAADREALARLSNRPYVQVEFGGRRWRACCVNTYGAAEAGELVLLVGSQGKWEVAQVNGSAASYLAVRPGDLIKIHDE